MRGKTVEVQYAPGNVDLASMRPPLNAGEDIDSMDDEDLKGFASMRPPLNAGEDKQRRTLETRLPHSFNEAPAECGGRRQKERRYAQRSVASMRPPLNAGEDKVDSVVVVVTITLQ